MKPAVVVDVGNSRIKWGRCGDDRVAQTASLPHDDLSAWRKQLDRWELALPQSWLVAGVHPKQRDTLVEFLREGNHAVHVLKEAAQLPLKTLVEKPDHVGIDRLLNAVAANRRRQPSMPAVIVDTGSAVTVDWLNEDGAFCGGAILPGTRLMAQALHDYTALLPLVEFQDPDITLPGKSTTAAIEAGIHWAVVGGIRSLIAELSVAAASGRHVWLTGGDAPLLQRALDREIAVWPDMTLEGIRLTAETMS